MTQYLESLEAGATMLMNGPKGKISYMGFGDFKISAGKEENIIKKTRIGCVAGGTGITPCY